MKSALSASGVLLACIALGVVALVGNQPGVLVAVFCTWTPLVAWFSIAWYRALFAGSRRLAFVAAEDRHRPAPTTNGRPSRIMRPREEDTVP